jgi:hypothetical protein
MDQTASIAKSLKTIWTAYSALATDVPGGLLFGLEKAGTVYPFASLHIVLGKTQYTTGLTYIQDYHVVISVWATQSVGQAGQIQQDIYAAYGYRSVLASLTNGARLVQLTLDTSALDEDPQRQFGQFVLIAKHQFILTIEALRP